MIAMGLPASPGAAVGQVVFTAEDAEAWHAQGKAVILVNYLFSPHDFTFKNKHKMILVGPLLLIFFFLLCSFHDYQKFAVVINLMNFA